MFIREMLTGFDNGNNSGLKAQKCTFSIQN